MPPELPAVHALHFLSLLERWGVDAHELAEQEGLAYEALSQPGARLSLASAERLIQRGRELTGEPEVMLGCYLGLQMRVSAHGFLGFAAMTAPTVRDALQIAVRFAPTHTNVIALELRDPGEHGEAEFVILERAELGAAREVVVAALMVGLWQMGNAVTGRMLLEGRAEVTFPEPKPYTRFSHLLPATIRFGQRENRLVFARALLDLPLVMADVTAQQLAREQCERELDALTQEKSLADRVRSLLDKDEQGFPSIGDVARALHMSDRTLKRKLMAQGTSFIELLDGERRARATALLRSRELTLDQIAERLGYSELSNFTRAFRRWTGTTPTRYRRSLHGEAER